MDKIPIRCPTASIGSGFSLSSLKRGLHVDQDVIAADAGFNDAGVSCLGSGKPMYPRATYRRDLYHVLLVARFRGRRGPGRREQR